jgi:hypothetical protein
MSADYEDLGLADHRPTFMVDADQPAIVLLMKRFHALLVG